MIKRLIFATLFSIHTFATAFELPGIQLTNTINECVTVTAAAPYAVKNKTYVDADFTVLKEISHCGCKTLNGVFVLYNADRKALHYRPFLLRESHREKLYIGKNATQRREYEVRISCMGPD